MPSAANPPPPAALLALLEKPDSSFEAIMALVPWHTTFADEHPDLFAKVLGHPGLTLRDLLLLVSFIHLPPGRGGQDAVWAKPLADNPAMPFFFLEDPYWPRIMHYFDRNTFASQPSIAGRWFYAFWQAEDPLEDDDHFHRALTFAKFGEKGILLYGSFYLNAKNPANASIKDSLKDWLFKGFDRLERGEDLSTDPAYANALTEAT